jgi:hypothetical protein
MKWFDLFLLILISGCYINPQTIETMQLICKDHGGIDLIKVAAKDTVYCKDGFSVTLN